MSPFISKKLNRIRFIANTMDSYFKIPVLNVRIGLDALLGFLPVAGDTLGAMISFWILKEAWDIGIPAQLIRKMLWNIAKDLFIGCIPVFGDIFDITFRANLKNLEIIEGFLQKTETN